MSGIDAGAVDAFDDSFDAMGQFTDTVAGDLRDPYPALAEKRRTSPIELVVQADFGGGAAPVVNVYTYDLVAQVLRDNVTFSSGASSGPSPAKPPTTYPATLVWFHFPMLCSILTR